MSRTKIKFGTDGWRAIIAEDFTFANVRVCAQGVATYLKSKGLAPRGLVIGYDTRFSSEHFAEAAAEVVTANGIKVYLCDKPTPTPVVSYTIVEKNAGGAVIITASHNPGIWNGFKYKPEYAGSASPEVVAELERLISDAARSRPKALTLAKAQDEGLLEHVDAAPAYLAHLAKLVDLKALRDSPMNVVIDSMYGAGAGYLKALLSGGRIGVREIHSERNPLFPGMAQPEPITQNLVALSATVKESGADVGVATDGDADRLGIIDEKGGFINQLQAFALLALYLLEVRGERGPLVKSITTTSMLYRLGEIYKVPVFETPVGFKYLGPVMMREDALVAGEESGGYAFRGHIPERDGILSALYFLDLMARLRKKPTQVVSHLYDTVGPHYYNRVDLTFPERQRESIRKRVAGAVPDSIEGTKVKSADTSDGFRFILEDGSWVLIRFSGTEPLLRIYAETTSPVRVDRLLAAARKIAGI